MRFIPFIVILMLTACMTAGPREKGSEKRTASKQTTSPKSNFERIGLAPRSLESGECGLFIWQADKTKNFIAYEGKKGTVLYHDGREVNLKMISKAEKTGEHHYEDPEGKSVSILLQNPEKSPNGVRYKAGRLTSMTADGWERVTPVVALYNCQDENPT